MNRGEDILRKVDSLGAVRRITPEQARAAQITVYAMLGNTEAANEVLEALGIHPLHPEGVDLPRERPA